MKLSLIYLLLIVSYTAQAAPRISDQSQHERCLLSPTEISDEEQTRSVSVIAALDPSGTTIYFVEISYKGTDEQIIHPLAYKGSAPFGYRLEYGGGLIFISAVVRVPHLALRSAPGSTEITEVELELLFPLSANENHSGHCIFQSLNYF